MPGTKRDREDLFDCATSALGWMKKHGNRASPRAYEVWLTYCTGTNSELNADIDALTGLRRKVIDQDLEDLHARHLRREGAEQEIGENTSQVQDAVDQVLAMVSSAGDNIRGYGDTLQGAAVTLRDTIDVDQVRGAVRTLIESTRRTAQRSRELEEQLSHQNQHISDLRSQLVSLQAAANTDPLTGLHNRRAFETALAGFTAEAASAATPLTLSMVDIDFFKQFNDTHGHQIGDQVLKLVGRVLRDALKGRDVAARYGGEEFAILLPETRLADAVVVAEQVRSMVESKALLNRTTGQTIGTIGLSAGVSEYRPREPIAAFLARADAALYRAKNTGRGRVCSEDGARGEA